MSICFFLCSPGSSSAYLVLGRKVAPAFVPCDLGMGLARHQAIEVQGLPFGQM